MIRRLFTRPIHWLERTRPYPIRHKIYEAPALSVPAEGSKVVAVLTIPDTFDDAVWAAYSIMKQLPSKLRLMIVVDGEVDATKQEKLRSVLPGSEIKPLSFFVDAVSDYANIHRFATTHILGRKMSLLLWLNQHNDLLYSDSDVLALGEMPEVREAVEKTQACYIGEAAGLSGDAVLLEAVKKRGLDYARNLNSGFFYAPKGTLNIDLAESLLVEGGYNHSSWFPEQTLIAILMHHAGAVELPLDRYVVSVQRQFYFETDVDYSRISLRHFTKPVRPLMYSRGMPYVWRHTARPRTS